MMLEQTAILRRKTLLFFFQLLLFPHLKHSGIFYLQVSQLQSVIKEESLKSLRNKMSSQMKQENFQIMFQ